MEVLTDRITVELDACEPGQLLENQFPQDLWVRLATTDGPSGWPVVEICGPRATVKEFVVNWWDEETWDVVKEEATPA